MPLDKLVHENAVLGSVLKDSDYYLGIQCNSESLPRDIGNPSEDLTYSGHANDLIMTQKFRIIYPCKMNMQYFPFDLQTCAFKMKIKTKGNLSVVLQADPTVDSVAYSGPVFLQEFEVSRIK